MTAPKRKQAPIEAWAVVSPSGQIWSVRGDYDDAVGEISDNLLMREYRLVHLTASPKPASSAEVARLTRQLRKLYAQAKGALLIGHRMSNVMFNLKQDKNNHHADVMGKLQAEWDAVRIEEPAALAKSPRRTTKPTRSAR